MLRAHNQFRVRVHAPWCVYCGSAPQTDDHFPPVAYTGPTSHGLILPACSECNSRLGSAHPNRFFDRAALAKENIRRKYRKILAVPDWSEDELEEMSTKFAIQLAATQRLKRDVQKRLAWDVRAGIAYLMEQGLLAPAQELMESTGTSTKAWWKSLCDPDWTPEGGLENDVRAQREN